MTTIVSGVIVSASPPSNACLESSLTTLNPAPVSSSELVDCDVVVSLFSVAASIFMCLCLAEVDLKKLFHNLELFSNCPIKC